MIVIAFCIIYIIEKYKNGKGGLNQDAATYPYIRKLDVSTKNWILTPLGYWNRSYSLFSSFSFSLSFKFGGKV